MAISITQRPSTILDTYPVYDPVIYVVKETSVGTYKFSYTCTIEHYNGSTYVAAATLRIPKNSEDVGVFDLAEILQAYFTHTLPAESAAIMAPAESAQRFKFTFGSEQAATATGAPIANASTVIDTDQLFYSGQALKDTSGYAENSNNSFALDNSATDRMLTSSGWPQYNPRYDVRADEKGSIDFVYDQTTDAATKVRITYYGASGLLSATDITLATYATGSAQENAVMRFYCYPQDLDDHGAGAVRPSDAGNSGWTRYTLQFRKAVNESVTHTFYLTDQCAPQELRFQWLNQFGGWEQMYTTGNWRVRNTYTDKRYETVRGNWFTTSGTTNFAYSAQDRGTNRMVTSLQRTFNVATGVRIKEDNGAIESLLRSRSVFVTNPESDSPTLLPCVIDAKSLNVIEQFHPEIREYTFDMMLSNQPQPMTL